jgi:hypothetical protein
MYVGAPIQRSEAMALRGYRYFRARGRFRADLKALRNPVRAAARRTRFAHWPITPLSITPLQEIVSGASIAISSYCK